MQKILLLLTLSIACRLGYAQGTLTLQGDTLINMPGRQVLLNQQGFPQQITFLSDSAKTDLLAENIHFHFTRASDGKDIKLKSGGLQFTSKAKDKILWTAADTSDELEMKVAGSIWNKGLLRCNVTVKALQDVSLKDITMHIPFQPDLATNMQGLGLDMGPRPDSLFRWKWPPSRFKMAAVWLGSAKAGLRYSLNGSGWENGGKGGITIGIKGRSMLANNYNGERMLHKGDTLDLTFLLYIAPR